MDRVGELLVKRDDPVVGVLEIGAADRRDLRSQSVAEAASRPWVHFIDIWSMFTDENGNYTAFLPDASGEQIRVRQEEGIHLTRTATIWVSERVYQAMQRDFNFSVPK